MLFAISNLIIKIFGVDASKARRIAWIVLIGGLLLVLAIFGWIINSCQTRNFEKKKDEIKTNITTGKIESNIQANIVNQAANVSNQSLENVNAIKNIDSNKYQNNFDEAKRKFCERFPNDSICTK
jgi:uncharacterized membrane protein YsdA (DUF1294 family)